MPLPNPMTPGTGSRYEAAPDPGPSPGGLTLARFWAILYGDPPTDREREAIVNSPTLREHATEVLRGRGAEGWQAPSPTPPQPPPGQSPLPPAPRDAFARFAPAAAERSAHAGPADPPAGAFRPA